MAAASAGIAALPMYDHPACRAATDRLWALIRDTLRVRGIAAPDALTRGTDDLMALWRSPDLVLAQTCGMPYRVHLRDAVTLIGTPDYALPGCPPGHYRSVIVARGALPRDWRGLRLAVNDAGSQSGWAALANDWPTKIPQAVRITGSHAASLGAVAAGDADLAALDAQTWRQLHRYAPDAAQVRVVAQTTPTPGLPFITRAGQDPAPYRAAITDAIAALSPPDRAALDIAGLAVIPAADYLAIPVPPAPPDPTAASAKR